MDDNLYEDQPEQETAAAEEAPVAAVETAPEPEAEAEPGAAPAGPTHLEQQGRRLVLFHERVESYQPGARATGTVQPVARAPGW